MANVASVKIIDNSKQYKEMLEDAIIDICDVIGDLAEGHAKDGCPVDTGRLRASITNATVPSERAVYIGSNVEYAEVNELHNKRKPHFLRNAATQHTPEYKAVVLAKMNA